MNALDNADPRIASLVQGLCSVVDSERVLKVASGRLVCRPRESFRGELGRLGGLPILVEDHPGEPCLRGTAIGIAADGRVALARFSEFECWAAYIEDCALSRAQRAAVRSCIRRLARDVALQGPSLVSPRAAA